MRAAIWLIWFSLESTTCKVNFCEHDILPLRSLTFIRSRYIYLPTYFQYFIRSRYYWRFMIIFLRNRKNRNFYPIAVSGQSFQQLIKEFNLVLFSRRRQINKMNEPNPCHDSFLATLNSKRTVINSFFDSCVYGILPTCKTAEVKPTTQSTQPKGKKQIEITEILEFQS